MLETDPSGAGVLGTYRGDLVRAARTRLGAGGADAEDVVHDVVVRMLRGGKQATDMATPGAYLRRAVGNECVSRWRRTSREVIVAELPDQPRMAPDEAVLDRIALNDAMRALTPRQQKVIVLTVLAALLITLIPTTIGGLLSAIGIAGMDRLVRFNIMATSGRAV